MKELILITGLSGAGKSTLLRILEDMGYYTVDNVPPHLIPELYNISSKAGFSKIAVVCDARWKNIKEIIETILALRNKKEKCSDFDFSVIFLKSSMEILISRFKKLRRVHPVKAKSLEESILKEIELMRSVEEIADYVLDTAKTTPNDLRKKLVEIIKGKSELSTKLILISFGYKYGIPNEADYIIDVRFLPNPYYIEDIYKLDGRHEKVQEFLELYDETGRFLKILYDFLLTIQELYSHSGRMDIVVGIGCTGGKHRSVYVVEKLAEMFNNEKKNVEVVHRDVDKE